MAVEISFNHEAVLVELGDLLASNSTTFLHGGYVYMLVSGEMNSPAAYMRVIKLISGEIVKMSPEAKVEPVDLHINVKRK